LAGIGVAASGLLDVAAMVRIMAAALARRPALLPEALDPSLVAPYGLVNKARVQIALIGAQDRPKPGTRATSESISSRRSVPRLSLIKPGDLRRWVTALSTKLAPASVAIAYRILSQIMRAAEDAGYIGRSPCRGVRLPRVGRHEMRFLSAGELEHLADAPPAAHLLHESNG
jgi:hypothetical protein